MIIHNLYVVSIAFFPFKANAPLIVNVDVYQYSGRQYVLGGPVAD